MSRTREEILEDIEYCTKMAEYYTKWAEEYTKLAEKYTKWAEECTKWAEYYKEELKEFDAKEKGE